MEQWGRHRADRQGVTEYVEVDGNPDRRVVEYVPLRRVVGFVARSAAAGELLGRIDTALESAAAPAPEPPQRPERREDDELPMAA